VRYNMPAHWSAWIISIIGLIVAGCDEAAKPPPPPSAPPAAKSTDSKYDKPPAAPPQPTKPAATPPPPAGSADTAATKPAPSGAFIHEGLRLPLDPQWIAEPPPTGPLAAKAAYRLPKAEGDAEDATLRITHFPNMKGMEEANITRWVAQVRRADDKPATREDAKISTLELGPCKITIVDITGSVSTAMMGPGDFKPNYRAINAMIDHDRGPHFIRALGPAATMAKWEKAIDTMLRGATPAP